MQCKESEEEGVDLVLHHFHFVLLNIPLPMPTPLT